MTSTLRPVSTGCGVGRVRYSTPSFGSAARTLPAAARPSRAAQKSRRDVIGPRSALVAHDGDVDPAVEQLGARLVHRLDLVVRADADAVQHAAVAGAVADRGLEAEQGQLGAG